MSIKAIYYDSEKLGKTFKGSKKKFTWKFELDGMQHTIEFMVSVITGKKKVFQDGKLVFKQQKVTKSFQYPFSLGRHLLVLNLHNKQAELRIDNYPFNSLYDNSHSGGSRMPPPTRSQGPLGPPSQQPSKAGAGWDEIREMQGKDDRYDDIPDGWNHEEFEEVKTKPKEKVSGADFFDKEKARSMTTK
jgi:hypothetical protein